MSERTDPPGWYPVGGGTTLHWWNGSGYSGQTWDAPPGEQLYDLVVVSIHSKINVREKLITVLGMSSAQAKQYVQSLPVLIAKNVALGEAQAIHAAVTNINGMSVNFCEAEVRPVTGPQQQPQPAQQQPQPVQLYCTNCGTAIGPGDAFCTECGQPVA